MSSFYFIVCVLSMSFSMCYMNATRFTVPLEVDVGIEYHSARVVEKSGWDPKSQIIEAPVGEKGQLGGFNILESFSGAIITSILPVMISRLLGTSVFNVFSFVYPMMVAFLPLFCFVAIHRFFGDSYLTYFSTALIPLVFSFREYWSAYRQAVALELLLMTIFCLLLAHSRPRDKLIVMLFVLGVVSSHYTIGYLTIAVLALLFLFGTLRSTAAKRETPWRSRKLVTLPTLLGCSSIVMSWLIIVEPYILCDHINVVWLFFERGPTSLTVSREAGYAVSNPRGTIVTTWMELQLLLTAIGGWMTFRKLLRQEFNDEQSFMVVVGLGLLGYAFLSFLLWSTAISTFFVEPTRSLQWGLPFNMLFLSLCLFNMGKKGRLTILVVLFVFLTLPMNMMLPSHEYDATYHSLTKKDPEEILLGIQKRWLSRPLGEDYVIGGEWIVEQISKVWSNRKRGDVREFSDSIQVDHISWLQLRLHIPTEKVQRYRPPILLPLDVQVQKNMRPVQYLVVTDLYLRFGLWYYVWEPMGEEIIFYNQTSSVNDPSSDILYNNNALALLYREE